MEDDHVDRPGVEVRQRMKLTGTNRSIDLISRNRMCSDKPERTCRRDTYRDASQIIRFLLAWWLLREAPTRTHSELGRETSQRRWYFVLRHGRVGRRQANQNRISSSHDGNAFNARRASRRRFRF